MSCSPLRDLERPPASVPASCRRRARWRPAERVLQRHDGPVGRQRRRRAPGVRRRPQPRARARRKGNARARELELMSSRRRAPRRRAAWCPTRTPSSEHLRADLGLRRQRHEAGQLRQRQRDRLVRRAARPRSRYRAGSSPAAPRRRDASPGAARTRSPTFSLNNVLGRLTLAGVGSMSSATDFAVNANHATVASTANPVADARSSRGSGRDCRAVLAAPGLNAIGVIATSARTAALACELVEIGRRRIAGRDDPVDAHRERVVGDAALEPRAIECDDIAVAAARACPSTARRRRASCARRGPA